MRCSAASWDAVPVVQAKTEIFDIALAKLRRQKPECLLHVFVNAVLKKDASLRCVKAGIHAMHGKIAMRKENAVPE